jgi:ABC-type sugar transport system permease subunit
VATPRAEPDNQGDPGLNNGFTTYDILVVRGGTRPAGETSTVATEVIRVGFTLNRIGLALAMAVIMLSVVASVTAIVVGTLQRRAVSG